MALIVILGGAFTVYGRLTTAETQLVGLHASVDEVKGSVAGLRHATPRSAAGELDKLARALTTLDGALAGLSLKAHQKLETSRADMGLLATPSIATMRRLLQEAGRRARGAGLLKDDESDGAARNAVTHAIGRRLSNP